MSKKTVLLATRPLVPPWDEASKNFAYFLARNVSHKNVEMHILTTPQKLEGLEKNVVAHPLYRTKNSTARHSFLEKTLLPIYLFFQGFRYDIIHYLFTPTRLNAFILNHFIFGKAHIVQTVATVREDLYQADNLHSLFFADKLITNTLATKQKLEGLGFQDITCIYPGIDLDTFCPQPKNQETLSLLGFNEKHFIVTYVGEYVRLGATDMIADAFIDYFRKNPATDIRLVFPGRVKNAADAKKKNDIEKRFADANLLGYVHFPPRIILDIVGLYNTSDLIIFPVADLNGKFDVPLVIIEAYACGKPVILSDLAEFREFANERICVTIPKDSGVKLIESVAYLKDNKAVRESLGREARAFVEQHFDLKNTAKQYSEIYESLS